ncbi:MAG: cyanophycin synthetase, partial [Rickettsiales bacterium]
LVPLVGEFQVMNILAALGLVVGCGGDLEKTLGNITKLKGVSGRLEQVVTTKSGASVFIDYAHTPLALANILNTLRPHTKAKLYVVFGCGGDRDVGKRPQMGKIANELADFTIVTDDNPRSEDSAVIRAAILAGCSNKTSCKEVADRAQAIYFAIEQLSAGDILVIAGKGHEKMQIVGDKHLPFDDAQVARDADRKLGVVL